MSLRHVLHVVGLLLVTESLFLALSGGVSLLYRDGAAGAIFLSALAALGAGLLAWRTTGIRGEIGIREGYAIVTFGWLGTAAFGALPYLLSGSTASYVPALFEATSGFTTTGATVFTEIEALPRGILFWRSLTHWLGGMGIIVLAVAILPYLGVGGMQLFRAEVPGPTPERLAPRIAQTAKLLWLVYAGLTVAQTVLYLLGGLDVFDAVTHTFGTLATGGFSPRNASLGAFDSPYVHYVTVLFMYLAGVNFTLHYRALAGRPVAYWRDVEWRFFTGVVVGAAVLLAAVNWVEGSYAGSPGGVERLIRDALFQATAITTTTGYVTADFEVWAPAAQLLLLALMFVGGMAGSTGGSVKAARIYLVLRHGLREVRKHLHPRAVLLVRMGKTAVREEILSNVLGFVFLYFLLFIVGAVVLAFLGVDVVTALAASAATLGNVGPGLGDVGPTDHYGWLPAPAQVVLIFLMIVGRLEIYTVLLLFHPEMWRRRGERRREVVP